jgi:hypothetical protein
VEGKLAALSKRRATWATLCTTMGGRGGGGDCLLIPVCPDRFRPPAKWTPAFFGCDQTTSRVLLMLCGWCGRACVCPVEALEPLQIKDVCNGVRCYLSYHGIGRSHPGSRLTSAQWSSGPVTGQSVSAVTCAYTRHHKR